MTAALAGGAASLPASICSAEDLQAVIVEIREYAKWHAHAAVKQQVGIADAAAEAPMLSSGASELLGTLDAQADSKLSTRDQLDGLIIDLTDLKTGAPRLTITLAAPAHASLKRTLVAWCRKNVAADVLVSFSFNSTILGGMVVRYGSHVYDWSFRREIMANRAKFPEVLRSV